MTSAHERAGAICFGTAKGETCWRDGCQGVIAERAIEGCTCHINPPCSACSEPREYCPSCGWEARNDHGVFNDYVVTYADRKHGVFGGFDYWKPRPLDPRRIDFRVRSHTSSSQICEGVYPEGTTRAQVESKVRGTFGGRFEYFANGKFKYVAYTD